MQSKKHFAALDGLRGVAAICVLLHHTFLGTFRTNHFYRGYLSVDLFFMLSAFVLGYAKEGHFRAGLRVHEYMKQRFIRLYPMMFLGAVIGAIWIFGGDMPLPVKFLAVVTQFLLIPFAISRNDMFPVNGPQWSLLLEIFANFLHILTFRWLSTGRLALITVASGALLLLAAVEYKSLSIGWSVATLPGGIARLVFGYSMGLLLYRLHAAHRLPTLSLPGWLCLLALPLALYAPVGKVVHINDALRDAGTVLVFFPVLLVLSFHTTFSRIEGAIASCLALVSYPLYSLHKPLKSLTLQYVIPHTHGAVQHLVVWMTYMTFTVILAYLVGRYAEAPMQSLLRNVLSGSRKSRDEQAEDTRHSREDNDGPVSGEIRRAT